MAGAQAPLLPLGLWPALVLLAELSTAYLLPGGGGGVPGGPGGGPADPSCTEHGSAFAPAAAASTASKPSHIPDVYSMTGMCCGDYEYGDYGAVVWPATYVNDEARELCPYGARKDSDVPHHGYAFVKRLCMQRPSGPQWAKSNYEECAKDSSVPDDAAKGADEAKRITADPDTMTVKKYLRAVDLISKAHSVAAHNRTVARDMLQAMSNMVAVRADVQRGADADGSQRRELFHLMESHGRGVWMLENETSYEQRFENLHLLVVRVPNGQSEDIEFSASYASGNASTKETDGEGPVVVRVPREAFRPPDGQPDARAAGMEVRVRFMVVRNAELLSPPGTRSGAQQVVSATVSVTPSAGSTVPADDSDGRDIPVGNLGSPVHIQLPLDSWGATHVCAYYNNDTGTWQTDGVRLRMDRGGGMGGYVVCEASHLTPFTLLLDPYPRRDLGDLETPINIMGYVGCTLSILGLVATVITYKFLSRCGEHRWGRVLVQLSVSLIMLHITFLTSNFKGQLPPEGCIAVAILVHTFLLSSFCWMLVEALVLYQMLITVFASGNTKFFLKRFLFAWGAPVAIVLACGLADPTYYMDTHPDYCVTSGANALQHDLATLLPCCVVLCANLFIFIRLSVVLLRLRRPAGLTLANAQDPPRVTWAQIRSVGGTAFLLGVTWLLSPLAADSPALQLASTALNSLQGVVIFVSRVLTHHEAGRAWRKRLFPKPELRTTSASYSVSDKTSSWFRMGWSNSSGSVASPPPPKEPQFSRHCFSWCSPWKKCIPTSRSSSQNAITTDTDLG